MRNLKDLINIHSENCFIHIHNDDNAFAPFMEVDDEIDPDKEPFDEKRCTMCGCELSECDQLQNFGFDYHVGYGSRHDGEIVRARFCCDCFDQVVDLIQRAGELNPIAGEYEI